MEELAERNQEWCAGLLGRSRRSRPRAPDEGVEVVEGLLHGSIKEDDALGQERLGRGRGGGRPIISARQAQLVRAGGGRQSAGSQCQAATVTVTGRRTQFMKAERMAPSPPQMPQLPSGGEIQMAASPRDQPLVEDERRLPAVSDRSERNVFQPASESLQAAVSRLGTGLRSPVCSPSSKLGLF